MQTSFFKLILPLLALHFIFYGCSGAKIDYDKAKNVNNIVLYRNFVNKYPDSKYTQDVLMRIENLYWEKAQKSGDESDFTEYLQRYPQGRYANVAEAKILQINNERENKAWEAAKNGNTINSYMKYIKEYQKGNYILQAEKEIDKIDNVMWNDAKNNNTISSYKEYLIKCKSDGCKHPKKALARILIIHDANWEDIKMKNDADAFINYWKEFPIGTNSKEALEKAMQLAPDRVKKTDPSFCAGCIKIDDTLLTCPDGSSPKMNLELNKDGSLKSLSKIGCF